MQTVQFGVEITCVRTVGGRFQRITAITVTVLQRIIEQSDSYGQRIMQTVEFSVEINCQNFWWKISKNYYDHSDSIAKNN